jgi:pimeloyl-ACP methyl ester carboxylesterase
MPRWRLRAAILTCGLVTGACTALGPVERHFLYRGQGGAPPESPPAGVARHVVIAGDGTPVRALELAAPRGGRTVVIFHNNRETAEDQLDLARAFAARGLGAVLAEYRGYGASQAAGAGPTEEGLYLDAEAVLAVLRARGVGPERPVLMGISLGTGVAAEMARRGHGSALVLVTPYTSIPELAGASGWMSGAARLVPDRFDTAAKCAEIAVPTVVVHGDADEIVPFWMGERVAAGILGARLVRVSGARHAEALARARGEIVEAVAEL